MNTNPKVPPVYPVPEPSQSQVRPESTPSHQQQDIAASAPSIPAYIAEPAVYRLVIDKDPVSGTFVYKTVDRVTGEIVTQLPCEEVIRLKDSASYTAGSLVDDKA
jgi:flagellar protein FlaG